MPGLALPVIRLRSSSVAWVTCSNNYVGYLGYYFKHFILDSESKNVERFQLLTDVTCEPTNRKIPPPEVDDQVYRSLNCETIENLIHRLWASSDCPVTKDNPLFHS